MSARLAQPLLRRTALLLALICLWISGGATLHHDDDDLLVFLSSPVGHSSIHQAAPAVPATSCAACQWEQTSHAAHAVAVHVVCSPFLLAHFAAYFPDALHLRSFDYTSLRGPPASCA